MFVLSLPRSLPLFSRRGLFLSRFFASGAAMKDPIQVVRVTGESRGGTSATLRSTDKSGNPLEFYIGRSPNHESAPSPLVLHLGALIGCENATTAFIASKLGISYTSLEWECEGKYDVRGFMGTEGIQSHWTHVKITGKMQTSATEEQVAELARRVAHQCPLSSTLHNCAGIEYETQIVKV